MFTIELNKQQLENLFSLLDRELKSNGLSSLTTVVDLYNVLLASKTKEDTKENVQQ